jgi:hypothetical protein
LVFTVLLGGPPRANRVSLIAVAVALLSAVSPVAARADGSVSGVARYPGGAPAAGVQVDISPDPAPSGGYLSKGTLTDVSGRWVYGPLTPGAYVATFVVMNQVGSNETQASQHFTVQDGEEASLATELTGPPGLGEGTLEGTVTASSGIPAFTAKVALSSPGPVSPPPVWLDGAGGFKVRLVAGTYGISISREDALADSAGPETLNATATIAAGEAVHAAYALPSLPPLPVPSGTTALNSARDLGYLNQERRRWGLPAAVGLEGDWSQACAAHDAYIGANPNPIAEGVSPHTELPGRPGYSPGGRWAAGQSVLVLGRLQWEAEDNPWENAPYHLSQLLDPDIAQMGIDDSEAVCATTWPGVRPPTLPVGTVLTYPGDGTTGLPPAENAAEWPSVPGAVVGIPEGTIAGRELFVYEEQPPFVGQCFGFCYGGAPTLASASLIGPAGPIEVRSVDGSNGSGASAILIPVKPLAPFSAYTATVTLAASILPVVPEVTHQWTFTTGAPNPLGNWHESGAGTPTTTSARAPQLTDLMITPRRFRPARKARARHGGATVSYEDSAAALTTFIVQRKIAGLVRGRRCVAPARSLRGHRRCTTLIPVYSFVHHDRRGRNSLRLSGRIGRRVLAGGRYRLRAQPRDAGLPGRPIVAAFRVIA